MNDLPKSRYFLVDGSMIDVELRVSELLDDGYIPVGSPVHEVGVHPNGVSYDLWLQAVYKVEQKG